MSEHEIPKAYDPTAIERHWAQEWVNERLFTPEVAAKLRAPDKGTYSLAIPPPNVTGSLHMGHMLEHTQIDILMRWRRMQGYRVLWLPGTDHAGIATQVVVERQLAKEGLTRQQLGREEFERRVWQWKAESGDRIKTQMTRLGASVDWSRECFTMDAARYRAVLEAFLRLYREGLIYRGRYIVNWCPRCQTALSDLEVVHREREDKLYFIKYPMAGTPEFVVVATTRPETMLGDTAVAVHPEDDRYRTMVGRKALLPLMNREIPILADEFVDRDFGTGAIKVTPAHDADDFQIGRRHGLAEITVMDDQGRLNEQAGAYQGLDRYEARLRIVDDLKAQGLLQKTEPYRHGVGLCDRCKTPVEPRISVQWFCKMNDPGSSLAGPAIQAVRDGTIQVVPEQYARIYLDWMERIYDWCISRQLWWGHRIPVWHCQDCKEMTPAPDSRVEVVDGRPQAASPPEKCEKCGSAALMQDTDVLDTWFSSGLWPFSTLGWPDETADLRDFYPTTLMINGFDILFFWDARMIMMGLKFMPRAKVEERIPFRALYIHALVRDPEGQKMSKTRGNVVDPLELIEEYGTDATRFTLAVMAAPGTDIALSPDRLRSYRAFANKIWNAARFIAMNRQRAEQHGVISADFVAGLLGQGPPERRSRSLGSGGWVDVWLRSRLHRLSLTVNTALEEFRFHEAAHEIYHFFWHEFCDWYLEWVKPVIAGAGDGKRSAAATDEQRAAWAALLTHFEWALRLLHPFMPFLTEELWRRQFDPARSLALADFPVGDAAGVHEEVEREMALVQEAIVALRDIRAAMKVETKRQVPAELSSNETEVLNLFRAQRESILRLASLSQLDLTTGALAAEGGVLRHSARFDARVPFSQADVTAEIKRLRKEKEKLERDLSGMRARLADDEFRRKAPDEVVRGMEQRQSEYNVQYEKVARLLESLEGRAS
ncbi:MAG: valine--tRNA ligase [Candidatus Acidiferrales bacterium]